LKMQVVAEGVETYEQAEILKLLGCDTGQGYFYSKPVPADEILLKYQSMA
ncbi:MAG: EAL domain-containing protein, partial [Proteobacteria bacterium]|nr:EAL domain-containing protein [Pseudomonadota bacterium]